MQGVKWATMTSTGADSTTNTQLNGGTNLVMPSWARNIVAVRPAICCVVYEADEPAIVKFSFTSDDCNITPYEILSNPIVAYGDTAGMGFQGKLETYPMNCPLNGGEEIAVWGKSLQAITGPIYAGCSLIISDQPPTQPQRFGKVGTFTATSAASEIAGTAYSIHGASRIVEVTGICTPEAIAKDDLFLGSFRITSGDFKTAIPCTFGFQPCSANEEDSYGPLLPAPARFKVDIPTNKTCVIQDYCTNIVDAGVEGKFVSAIMFEKVAR